MHELTVATGIIELAEATLRQNGMHKIHAINIVIGELTCVDESALRFALDPASKGSPLEGADINIIWVKALARCEHCSTEFQPKGFIMECPQCKGLETNINKGRELYVKSIEAE
ncbi:MAG: hydrogenase maturation nickel metallochaperone HypA [Bacteroidales bacterium]|nr:hydrogenase maturation nickel metallochaperone HypA [Bacteroidales bacterium]MDZ4203802.1 hydrogenase maturation nickel metallochaperone HypA [Bacteroidales bacterium]